MGYYNVRDLIGHFTKRRSSGKRCPHHCCRGRRPHPRQRKLVPDWRVLRALSDDQLAQSVRWDDEKSVKAFTREAARRDREDARRRARRSAREAEREDRALAIHAAYLQADHQTRGNLLSAEGRRRGIDPQSLWQGPESRVRKYASEELRAYFDQNGRLTAQDWNRHKSRSRDHWERMYGVY